MRVGSHSATGCLQILVAACCWTMTVGLPLCYPHAPSSEDNGGWGAAPVPAELLSRCDFPRVPSSMTKEEFSRRFLRPGRPAVIQLDTARQEASSYLNSVPMRWTDKMWCLAYPEKLDKGGVSEAVRPACDESLVFSTGPRRIQGTPPLHWTHSHCAFPSQMTIGEYVTYMREPVNAESPQRRLYLWDDPTFNVEFWDKKDHPILQRPQLRYLP